LRLLTGSRLCFLALFFLFSATTSAKEFCPLPAQQLSVKVQDNLFVEAMFDAEYIFRGRLFTYYNERCDGDICAFDGLVFKVIEQIDSWLSVYVETSWVEDCQDIWLHQMAWRSDKEKMFFEINKEYLLLAKDTPKGMVIFASRSGLKVKELQMRYELERIGRK